MPICRFLETEGGFHAVRLQGVFTSIAGLGALKTVITSRSRITRAPTADDRNETHDSGDIDSFVGEDDAISCAKAWAIEWCDESWD
jgi:hypothetical protein